MSSPSSPEAAREALLPACSPAAIIGASWAAFEHVRVHASEYAGRLTGSFAA